MYKFYIVKNTLDNPISYKWLVITHTITVHHNEMFNAEMNAFRSIRQHVKRLFNYDLELWEIKKACLDENLKTFEEFRLYERIKWDRHFKKG